MDEIIIKTKGRKEYIDAYINALLSDIQPELEESAKIGVELFEFINEGAE